MNSKGSIKEQLIKAGIGNGNALLVRVALRSINTEKS